MTQNPWGNEAKLWGNEPKHYGELPQRQSEYTPCNAHLQPRGQTKGQKTFFCQNSFQLMYNHKPKSNAPLRKKNIARV